MEHLIDSGVISAETGITDSIKLNQLINYAEAIYTENKKYNLTGHKTISDIIENLIIGSIKPLMNIDVPRGTLFADLGTGAGIPGVPFAIKHNEASGVLFDSNQKKIRFINKTASELSINNVSAEFIRVEDAGRLEDYRNRFDIVLTRAMSDIYTVAELGAPLLKTGGFIYLYVNETQKNFTDYLLSHIADLGLSVIDSSPSALKGINITEGVVLKKIKATDNKYPRRMPVITRMAMK